MNNTTISQLINKQGNAVKNQFILTAGNITTFQSYQSQIVDVDEKNKTIVFYPDYNYSQTTSKYRNQFLSNIFGTDINRRVIDKMISDGVYRDYRVQLRWIKLIG